MSRLILAHMFLGLIGIATGLISITGAFFRKPLPICNAIFLSTTAASCALGFVFLPTLGITSAQLVGFFVIFLLTLAAYARYIQRLNESWITVYAFTTVGALFLNILIATAQSFLHFHFLKSLAPTQESPIYITAKITLLLVFIVIALVLAKRTRT